MTDIGLCSHCEPLTRMLMIGCICSGTMAVSCSRKPVDSIVTGPSITTQSEDLAVAYSDKLKKLPFWCQLKKDDTAKINELMNGLGEIASQKTEVIRRAVDLYISNRRSEKRFYFEEWSNLYVLNRLVFNVPARERIGDIKFFGGWDNVPYDDKEVSILWPLSIDLHGGMELVGFHPGYNGDEYQALKEFDYLHKKYGRRQSKTK